MRTQTVAASFISEGSMKGCSNTHQKNSDQTPLMNKAEIHAELPIGFDRLGCIASDIQTISCASSRTTSREFQEAASGIGDIRRAALGEQQSTG